MTAVSKNDGLPTSSIQENVESLNAFTAAMHLTASKPGPAPAKKDRLQCQCGNQVFFVTRVDFTCSVCFKSYRD